MRVSQLEQFCRDGMGRLKEQKKGQAQERLEQVMKRAVQEQKALGEKRLREEREFRKRELRLVEEELERITDQADSLRRHITELQEQKNR